MDVRENISKVSCATIVKLDEDYLMVTVDSEAQIDIPQLEEISAVYNRLMGPDKPFYILTILPSDLNPSRELRNYWRRPERSRRKLAEAIVISGIAMALIANFVRRFEKPRHLVQYFKNEKDAAVWLEHVRKHKDRLN